MSDDFPQVIVEAAFKVGANTENYWHLGDPARGRLGRAALGPDALWADITDYVQHLSIVAASSSRTTGPLVQYEGGSAVIQLNNAAAAPLAARAFDPLNVNSPFYDVGQTITVPITVFPNAIEAVFSFVANDAQVATTTPQTQAAAQPATWTFVANDATANILSNAVPPSGMLFGSSGFAGQNAATSTLNLLDPAIGRAYEDCSVATYANTTYSRFIPAAVAQFITFKPTGQAAGIPYWVDPSSNQAAYNTDVQHAQTVLLGLSTRKGHRSSWWHEPVGNMTQSDWTAGNVNFYNDVLVPVNALRPASAPIWFAPCMNGFPDDATQATWWTQQLLDLVDEINWDCYGYAGTGDQVQRCHDFAVARGKPWSVGELGYTTTADSTDTQCLGVMQLMSSKIAGWTVAERPGFLSWFNKGHNLLTGLPQASAYWKNMCENQSVQPA